MATYQDQVLGEKYVTVTEKLSGDDRSVLMLLNFDVPATRLVKQVAMEFQAGEGWSRIPTGPDYAPTGFTASVGPLSEAPRRWKLWMTSDLDMGLSLHENNVKENDTIELRNR